MGSWKQQFRRIMNILRRRGQSREDAEDLVQEAFLRLHVFLEEGHDVRTPDAFLVRTALNLAVDARRKNVRDCRDQFVPETIEDLDLVIADLRPTPEENVAAEIRLREMRKVLDEKLSPTTREVFFLHRLEGLSHEEIAEAMGISLRSVEKRIARAITIMWMERRKE
jgi:RNA polymerase sigma factor (sigma-70 family)